jgi:hypothetical protein
MSIAEQTVEDKEIVVVDEKGNKIPWRDLPDNVKRLTMFWFTIGLGYTVKESISMALMQSL